MDEDVHDEEEMCKIQGKEGRFEEECPECEFCLKNHRRLGDSIDTPCNFPRFQFQAHRERRGIIAAECLHTNTRFILAYYREMQRVNE